MTCLITSPYFMGISGKGNVRGGGGTDLHRSLPQAVTAGKAESSLQVRARLCLARSPLRQWPRLPESNHTA
jgi:hypothetical protein